MERIVLGSGKTYIMEYTGTIPEDSEIEKEENLLGLIQGGASLEYTPTIYEATDDLGLTSKEVLTEETALFKTGIITWDGNTVKRLCSTARVTEDASTHKRTTKIGGIANFNRKKYIVRFVHEDSTDGDIRATIVGYNNTGISLTWAKDKETVINAEFKGKPMDSTGTLIQLDEDDLTIKA